MIAAVDELMPVVGTAAACRALSVNRATTYRRRRPRPLVRVVSPRPRPARSLDDTERANVLEIRHSPRFVDAAPAQVYATLLDQGVYLASVRTMYRLLAACAEVSERRNQLRRPAYARPELLATRPKELWSWDITKRLGPQTWTYYYLYVILDVFSRYVVGWMLAYRENARLAERPSRGRWTASAGGAGDPGSALAVRDRRDPKPTAGVAGYRESWPV